MNENLLTIILALIPVLGTVITVVVIPLILSKISAEKLALIVKWVGRAVQAAEMLFPEARSGEAKKEYVINFIDNMFNKRKIVITREQIEIIIESIIAEFDGITINKNK